MHATLATLAPGLDTIGPVAVMPLAALAALALATIAARYL